MTPLSHPLTHLVNVNNPLNLSHYCQQNGYVAAKKVISEYTPAEALEVVKSSGLKGRGGAGFPTGMKWSFLPEFKADDPRAKEPKYLICNADEMEPGTFKDRLLLEGVPHQLIEAMIIAGYIMGATRAYIFLRGEYHLAAERLQQAINEAYQANWLGKNIQQSGYSLELHLHTSAGRYICGEETALINALEGKRATPRAKPPFPQVAGLFGKPTIVNNVETLSNLPHIFAHGVDWYQQHAPESDAGTKIYGACGRINTPGLWELPMGVTIGKLLNDHAGGMSEGLKLKGLLPGGASTDFLLPEHLDVAMDYDSIAKAGSRLGTGGLIVLDDKNCPVAMVKNIMQFFAQESCGWCTPCRDGTPWALEILTRIEQGKGTLADIDELYRLCDFMWIGKTHCALAPGAVEPLRSALNYFSDDFLQHIEHHCCPYHQGGHHG